MIWSVKMLLLKVAPMLGYMECCFLKGDFNNSFRYLKLTKRFFGRLRLATSLWDTYLGKVLQSLPM
jgi:hypothetical protein